MKNTKIIKSKYFILGLVAGLSMLGISANAYINTSAGTLGNLFEEIRGTYKLIGDNIKDNTIDSSEIENGTLTGDDINSSFGLWNKNSDGELYFNGKVGIGTNTITNGFKLDIVGGSLVQGNLGVTGKVAVGGALNIGEGKLKDSTIVSADIKNRSILNVDIKQNAIGNYELADNSVKSANIYSNTITAGDIAANAIGNSELADNSVKSANIYSNTITAGDIAANAIGNSELNNTANFTMKNLTVEKVIKAEEFLYDSDRRLKKDIVTLDDSLEKISKLRGVKFNWKSNDKKEIGLIAQEIEQVYPVLVHTDEKGMKSVKYGNVVAILIEGVKELDNKNTDLENRIKLLEEKIDKLTK